MALDKKPDAVAYPHGMFPGGPGGLPHAKRIFGPVLRCLRVAVGDQETFNFARPFPIGEDTPGLLWPEGHPWAKQERHVWFLALADGKGGWTLGEECASYTDHPNLPKFGYLKEDPYATDDAVMRSIHGNLARRMEEKLARMKAEEEAAAPDVKINRAHRLANLGIIDNEERDRRIAEIEKAALSTPGAGAVPGKIEGKVETDRLQGDEAGPASAKVSEDV